MKKVSESKLRRDRLTNLISACRDRLSDEEIINSFNGITGNEYGEVKEKEDIISDLVMEGYCIFKPDNSNQSDKLKEYAEQYIFPYYNEQMTAILF